MNEEFLRQVYDKSFSDIGSFDEFLDAFNSNKGFRSKVYNAAGGSTVGTFDQFMEASQFSSEDSEQPSQSSSDNQITIKDKKTRPNVSSVDLKNTIDSEVEQFKEDKDPGFFAGIGRSIVINPANGGLLPAYNWIKDGVVGMFGGDTEDMMKQRRDEEFRFKKADELFFGDNAEFDVEDFEPYEISSIYTGIDVKENFEIADKIEHDEENPIFGNKLEDDIRGFTTRLLGHGNDGMTRQQIMDLSLEDVEHIVEAQGPEGPATVFSSSNSGNGTPVEQLGEHLLNIKDRISAGENVKRAVKAKSYTEYLKVAAQQEQVLHEELKEHVGQNTLDRYNEIASLPKDKITEDIVSEFEEIDAKLRESDVFNRILKLNNTRNGVFQELKNLPEEFKNVEATRLLNQDIQELKDERYRDSNIWARFGMETVETIAEGITGVKGAFSDTARSGLALAGSDRAARDIIDDAYSQLPDDLFRNSTREQRSVSEDVASINFGGRVLEYSIDDKGNIQNIYDEFGNVDHELMKSMSEYDPNKEDSGDTLFGLFKNQVDIENPDREVSHKYNTDAMFAKSQKVLSDIITMGIISYMLPISAGTAAGSAAATAGSRTGLSVMNMHRAKEFVSAVMTFNGQYAEEGARQGGITDPFTLGTYAFAGAATEGLIEAINPLSSKLFSRLGREGGEMSTRLTVDQVKKLLNKGTLKTLGTFAGKVGVDATAEAVEELIQENIAGPILNNYFNERLDAKFEPHRITKNGIIETVSIAAMSSLVAGGMANKNSLSPLFNDVGYMRHASFLSIKNPEQFQELVAEMKKNNPKQAQQYDQLAETMKTVSEASNEVINNPDIADHMKKAYVNQQLVAELDKQRQEGVKSPIKQKRLGESVLHATVMTRAMDVAFAHGFNNMDIETLAAEVIGEVNIGEQFDQVFDRVFDSVNRLYPNATQSQKKKIAEESLLNGNFFEFENSSEQEGVTLDLLYDTLIKHHADSLNINSIEQSPDVAQETVTESATEATSDTNVEQEVASTSEPSTSQEASPSEVVHNQKSVDDAFVIRDEIFDNSTLKRNNSPEFQKLTLKQKEKLIDKQKKEADKVVKSVEEQDTIETINTKIAENDALIETNPENHIGLEAANANIQLKIKAKELVEATATPVENAPSAPATSTTTTPPAEKQLTESEQITKAFDIAGKGIAEGGKQKARDYVARILAGEKAEDVLQGIGKKMTEDVLAVVAEKQKIENEQNTESTTAPVETNTNETTENTTTTSEEVSDTSGGQVQDRGNTTTEQQAAEEESGIEEIFANDGDILPVTANNEWIDEVRSSLELDPNEAPEKQAVDNMILDAYDNWVSKDGSRHKERSVALDAIAGVPLTAAQQIALANAVNELNTSIEAHRKVIDRAKAQSKAKRSLTVPVLLAQEQEILEELDFFTKALNAAGTTIARGLGVRAQLLNFNRDSEANMRARIKAIHDSNGTKMSPEESEMINKFATKIKTSQDALNSLNEQRKQSGTKTKEAIAESKVESIKKDKGKGKKETLAPKLKRTTSLDKSMEQLSKVIKGDIC